MVPIPPASRDASINIFPILRHRMTKPSLMPFNTRVRSCKASPRRCEFTRPPAEAVELPRLGQFARFAPFPEWFRVWRQVVCLWWVRLKFIHFQSTMPLWERREASASLREDLREALRRLKRSDLEGAIASLTLEAGRSRNE